MKRLLVLSLFVGIALSGLFWLLGNLSEPELLRSKKDPTLFLLIIRWDSAEGHLQGFRRSEQFREFFAHIKPYVGDILEMEHYEVTGVTA